MALFLDAEHVIFPKDDDDRTLFEARILNWNDSRCPVIALDIPYHFETSDGAYDGNGVAFASIKELLEDYLADFEEGACVNDFCAWLHDYADKLKAANEDAQNCVGDGE